MNRLPSVYIPHGGGPWPFVEVGFGPPGMWDALRTYLQGLVLSLPERPRAILAISAHWEEPVPTLMTSPHPPMLYDYSGFPKESYSIEWPAPGAPELAKSVRKHLEAAGFTVNEDRERGFDHGTFVPLKLAVPDANIPILQLSLIAGLDPKKHIEMGRALSYLREEGVFCVGSGSSYHNMRGFGRGSSRGPAEHFDSWLAHAMAEPPDAREELLIRWTSAPGARESHPREEHLLPLHVVAGIGHDARAHFPFRGEMLGVPVSAVAFT